MADKIVLEILKEKKPEEFTLSLADPDSRAETGCAAALTASQATALALRAARSSFSEADAAEERKAWLLRNLEIVRGYMVNLIDEDVKSRGPLRRALKEGEAQAIEASRQAACTINGEIINVMGKLLELDRELCALVSAEVLHYVAESAELALAACQVAKSGIFSQAVYCSEETFRYVTCRENELTFAQLQAVYQDIQEKAAVRL